MGLGRLLGQQSDGKKELSMQQVIAKLTEAVSFYSRRDDLAKQIEKSWSGRASDLAMGRQHGIPHEGRYIILPNLGAGEFAIKIGTRASVFFIKRSHGGDGLIGGTSYSSSTLKPLKIRELRDDQALAIYCSLCAMAVEDAKALKASLPKVKKQSKKRDLDKDDPLGATGHR